jgi:hypothetical protein
MNDNLKDLDIEEEFKEFLRRETEPSLIKKAFQGSQSQQALLISAQVRLPVTALLYGGPSTFRWSSEASS